MLCSCRCNCLAADSLAADSLAAASGSRLTSWSVADATILAAAQLDGAVLIQKGLAFRSQSQIKEEWLNGSAAPEFGLPPMRHRMMAQKLKPWIYSAQQLRC